MIKVIAAMTLITSGTLPLADFAYEKFMPTPVATAVISEKPAAIIGDGATVGGQAAFLIPDDLSTKQLKLMNFAKKVAKEIGVSPEVAQSVLLQETNAGGAKSYKVVNPGHDAYFGPMQIKLSATRDVLKKNPQLYSKYAFHTQTDDEVKANLILNDEFNIEVGVKYLKMLKEGYGFTGKKLVNAYNRGPGGVEKVDDDFHYGVEAAQKLSSWKSAKK